jgi:hypothetical protein
MMRIKYFIYSATIEALALTPLAISGMGHAGPNGGWLAWGSFLLNLPGFLCAVWVTSHFDLNLSWPSVVALIFIIQTLLLWLFVVLVWYLNRRLRSKPYHP